MKFFTVNNNFLQGLIGSLILQATITIFPSEAANFNNLSQIYIELNNFNHSPYEIEVDGDGTSTTIANEGLLWSNLDIDANFLVNTDVLAYAQSQAAIFGTATDYIGDLQFYSLLMGKFWVLKDNLFKFDLQGSLGLFQITDDLLLGNLSTLANINVVLVDNSTKSIFNVLEVLVELNTNSLNDPNNNNFLFEFSPDTQLAGYSELIDLEADNKTIQTSFTASFQKKFEQNTQVDLIIITQFCNYGSNIVDMCTLAPVTPSSFPQAVPEPSNNLAVINFLIGLGITKIFSKIINLMN